MVYQENFKVAACQVDMNNRATASALCSFMQEAASVYCLNEGISIEDLKPAGLTWMLLKQYVIFDYLPPWNTVLTVKTWPRNITGLRALRDYSVTDSGGNSVARSVANWVLIDVDTRKLVKIDKVVKHLKAVEESAVSSAHRIKIEKQTGRKSNVLFKAGYSDIDINHHVNNISYIRWCLDTIPLNYQKENILNDFSVEYIEEIEEDIYVSSDAYINSNTFYHELKRKDTGGMVCRASSTWKGVQEGDKHFPPEPVDPA